MNVVATAKNGVVNKNTIFNFVQIDNIVSAEYSGGKIEKGFLVGRIEGNKFDFSYCQLQTDNILDNGESKSILTIGETGKIRLTENFEWKSRPGEFGVNIFEEI